MAINYTDLFTVIGKIIKAANAYETLFATMKTNRDAIYDQLSAKNVDYIGDGIATNVSSHIASLSSGISYFVGKAAAVVVDPTLVTNHLPVANNNLNTVLLAMYDDMLTNSQTVEESNIGFGTIVKTVFDSATAGDLLYTSALDGFNAPVSNGVVNPKYYLLTNSDLGVVDTIYARCVNADTEGAETFSIFGNIAVPPYQELPESVGGSITINCADSENTLLTNADFETFAAGAFTGWTTVLDGATLVEETSSFYRGAKAMRFNSLSTSVTPEFKQTLTGEPDLARMYFAGCRAKSVAAEASGTADFTFIFKNAAGTSIGAAVTPWATKHQLPLTDTDWHLVYRPIFLSPTDDPSDVVLSVLITPTVNGVDGVIVDDVFLIPVHYFNGAGFGVANGSDKFQAGDIWTIPMTRSAPGVIQEFFRKNFAFQLPSTSSPTLADTLAT